MIQIVVKFLKGFIVLLAAAVVVSEAVFFSESIWKFCSEAIDQLLNNSFLVSAEAVAAHIHFGLHAILIFLNGIEPGIAILIGAGVSLVAVYPSIYHADKQADAARRERHSKAIMIAVMLQAEIRRLRTAAQRRLGILKGNEKHQKRVPSEMPAGDVYEAHLSNIVGLPEDLTKEIVRFYSTIKDAEFSRQMAVSEGSEASNLVSRKINTQSYEDQMKNVVDQCDSLIARIKAYRLEQGDDVAADVTPSFPQADI